MFGLMNLHDYLRSLAPDKQCRFARCAGTSLGYVRKVLSARSRFGEAICQRIELASSGAVTVEELRPDVNWHRVCDPEWPHPQGRPLVDLTRRTDVHREAAA